MFFDQAAKGDWTAAVTTFDAYPTHGSFSLIESASLLKRRYCAPECPRQSFSRKLPEVKDEPLLRPEVVNTPERRQCVDGYSHAHGVDRQLIHFLASVQILARDVPRAAPVPVNRRCTGGAVPDEVMIACLERDFKRDDHALNLAYQRALAAQPSPQAKFNLRALQRAWLKSTKATSEAARSEFAQDSAVQVAAENCYDTKQWSEQPS